MVTDAGKFEMRSSPLKTRLSIAGGLVFAVIEVGMVGVGLWGVVSGFGEGDLALRALGLGVVVLSLFGLLAFMFAVFRLIWQLRHRGPVLEVGQAGFHDQRLSVEPIPWSVIDSISTQRMSRAWSLVLSMSPEALRRYVHSRIDSRIARWRYRRLGGVVVGTGGLDRSFTDLVAAVDHWYRQRARQSEPGGSEDVSEVSAEFVAEVLGEALADAEHNPDGFAPFTAVLNMDGSQRRNRYELGDDPEGTLELARAELAHTSEAARCVAVVWDGYATTLAGDKEAVYVEVYELGRPCAHVVVQGYRRGRRGVSTTGLTTQLVARTDPIVPLTAELMRRHLGEWTEQCRANLRDFVQDLYGDLRAFDDDPHACEPLLEEWLSDLPFGELDTDDAAALLAPVGRYLAEVLIRVHHGRWEVTADGEHFSHVVVVEGNDGRSHQLDPFALVREYADAPLPPLSAILRHALDLVHR